jgi:hypothetical protein
VSSLGPGRRLRRVAATKPFQGGLTGIALVVLATLGLGLAGAAICGAVLLLIG